MENIHLSYYTIPVKLEDEENKYLLVHGYTGAIDIVDGSIWDGLKNYSSESTLSPEAVQLLQKRGYLTTRSKEEEMEYVSKLANLLHQAQSKLHKSFGFVVSYDCNFRCPYCFENEISQHGAHWSKRVFTKEMVDKAYDAIFQIEPRQELHFKQILLYGGEPFLRENREIVNYIIQKGHSLGYKFKAITNGYDLGYFKEFLSNEYFASVQITLDGYREYHDKRRFHYEEGDSFDKIIHNVGILLEGNVDIMIRINTDEYNFYDLDKLNALFEDLGYLGNSHFKIYSSVLQSYEINRNESGDIKYFSSMRVLNEKYKKEYHDNAYCQDFGIYKRFYSYLENKSRCRLYSASCSSQYGSYLFDPQGDIYTCLEVVGKKEFVIGNYIECEIQWTEVRKHWFERNVTKSVNCMKCRFALLCGGGCLAQVKHDVNGFSSETYCNSYKAVFPLSVNKAYRTYKHK